MLAQFDAMIGYVVLTNPFGSGGGDAAEPATRSTVGANEPGAFPKLSPVATHAVVVRPEHVAPDVRDIINEGYRRDASDPIWQDTIGR